MELLQPLHRAAQINPNRPITVMGDRVRTASESMDRISRLGGALRKLGVKDGDRVAIMALNGDRFHEFLFAVSWAGGIVVPINTRWSLAEVAYSLDDSGADILFVDATFAPLAEGLRTGRPSIREVIYLGEGDTPEGMLNFEDLIAENEPVEDARRGGSDIYGIFYTGGTTGFPKGVTLTHDNMMVSAYGATATGHFVSQQGNLLHTAPMFHLADIAHWMGGNLAEATHHFVPSFTPKAVAEAIARYKISDMLLVPTMIQMVVNDPSLEEYDFSSVKHLVYGASPMTPAAQKRARERFGSAELLQAYGMTEMAPVVTMLFPKDHDDLDLAKSVGRAAPHVEIRIIDEDGNDCAPGEVGEIITRGGGMMVGYWNQPETTAAAVIDGWMHTGDGARMDENGYVYVVDRIKDMIKTGGENVFSIEVENAIAGHPSVAMVAIIGLPDEKWGERVHAVVVLKPDATLTMEELDAYARERLTPFKIPRGLTIIEALPLSGAGKVLKKDLRAQLA